MANLYPNGIGVSSGSRWAKLKSLILAGGASPYRGNIYYVHHTGSNSNSGLEVNKPFATLAKALGSGTISGTTGTNVVPGVAVSGDVVAVLASHRETILYNAVTPRTIVPVSSLLHIKVIGCGDGDEMPYLDCQGDAELLHTQGISLISGIRFGSTLNKSNPANPTSTRIIAAAGASGPGPVFEDCIFDLGALEGDVLYESEATTNRFDYLYTSVNIASNIVSFSKCLFKNYNTIEPQRVQAARATGARTFLSFTDCTFDGGPSGWGPPAFSYGQPWLSSYFAVNGMVARDLVLVSGADFSIETSGVQYAFVNVKSSDGSSQVIS